MDQGDIVSPEYSEEEQSLLDEVQRSERMFDDLGGDLRKIDLEIVALAERNRQYESLSTVCQTLEELDELGGTHLFWQAPDGPDNPAEHIRIARQKIDEFGQEIVLAEERRQAALDKIDDHNSVLDCLHYDLRDAMERHENSKNEWLVEREPDALPNRVQVMPWSRGCDEDQRFRKSLGASLAASLAIIFLVSVIALPLVQRSTVDQLPERVAKLVRQQRMPPPPVEEPVIPEQELPEPEPEPELAEEQPPEDLPESATQPLVADVEQVPAREQVQSKGILAFRDSFASRANLRPTAQLGSQARVSSAGEDAVGRPERMMVSTLAPGSSGGINLADVSRDVGGGGQAIGGVTVSRVASSIGGGDGPNRPLSGGASAGRTDEEIQIVFDRYKAALYRLYNRELRKDPTLRGQLILRLTIEPDGSVSLCQVQSSDMDAPVLADQVVARVQNFDFGAKEDIVAVTIVYPIDFLPAA